MADFTIPPRLLHANVIPEELLSVSDREEVGALVEYLIGILDFADGDTDLELAGDELDGSFGEDDFVDHNYSWRGEPGCPISDPDADLDHLATLPEYSEDQAKGPTNEVRAYRIHRAAICEENFKPKSLLEAIYFACERDGISVTTWGRIYFHDPRFVLDLRNGRTPRPETEAKAWDCVRQREFA